MRNHLILLMFILTPALQGCSVMGGPQLGVTLDKNLEKPHMSYGWEAGPGFATVRANAGQVYRPSRDTQGRQEAVTYLVLEPWYYLGGSLGAAYSTTRGAGLHAGLWEGFGATLKKGGEVSCFFASNGRCAPAWSLAIGLRYLAGDVELYLSPKFGFIERVDFF